MKKIIIVQLFILLFNYGLSIANAGWSLKANFGGQSRMGAFSFQNGNFGYVGGGQGSSNYFDLWEYNSATNSWSQKADYPSNAPRLRHTSFSIGTKGFVACGIGNFGGTDQLWEYDMISNVWNQRANFGGGDRYDLTSFVIGNFGYVGLGIKNVNFNMVQQKDFHRYDTATNTWNQVADISGLPRSGSVAFGSNGFGYVIGGSNNLGNIITDVVQYNPSTNSWTQKQSIPAFLLDACCTAIGSKGYVLGGSSSSGSNMVYSYSTLLNSWNSEPPMLYPRGKAAPFVLADTIYVVGGNSGLPTPHSLTNQAFNTGTSVGINTPDNLPFTINPTLSYGRLYVNESLMNVLNNADKQLNFYSVEGKLVQTKTASPLMDISDLPDGLYYIKNNSGILLNKILLMK